MSDAALTHLFTAFVFALVSSVGLTLAWSLLLAVRHGKTSAPPRHLVQEALRLYPIAWLLERAASREIELGNARVAPDHAIVVSPYAVHRNPRYWERPNEFLPERWEARIDRRAWIPFGAGSQGCIAGSLSIDLASATLEALLALRCTVEQPDTRPLTGAALAPARFTLVRG
jgi:cytochrome P450